MPQVARSRANKWLQNWRIAPVFRAKEACARVVLYVLSQPADEAETVAAFEAFGRVQAKSPKPELFNQNCLNQRSKFLTEP